MQIDSARALVLRLIVAELLAPPGAGPLSRRPIARRTPPPEVGTTPTSVHDRDPRDAERGP